MRVQPHALVHTPHHILQLGVVLHVGLLPLSQHLINLLLSLQGTAKILNYSIKLQFIIYYNNQNAVLAKRHQMHAMQGCNNLVPSCVGTAAELCC